MHLLVIPKEPTNIRCLTSQKRTELIALYIESIKELSLGVA
jgi:hypothetical protein